MFNRFGRQIGKTFVNQPRFQFLTRISTCFKNVFQYFNNFPIRNQIIFFFLFVSLIPILIIGILSYSSSKEAIVSKTSEYSQNELSQTVQNLEMKIQDIESISMQFISNNQYNDLLKDYCNSIGTNQEYEKYQMVANLFQSIIFSNKENFIISFMCLTDTSKLINSGTLPDDFFNPRNKFFQKILAADGGKIWSQYKINRNHDIILGRVIKDIVTGEKLGILIIFIDEKVLSDVINPEIGSSTDLNSPGSFNMIIDNQGVIISSPRYYDDGGKNIFTLLRHPRKLRPLLKGQKNKDSFTDRINRQEVLLTCKAMGDRNWYLLSAAKISYLYKETRALGWKTFLIGIFFAVIAVILSIIVALNISNPLKQVVYSMKQAENGDFKIRVEVNRKDELGFLGSGFNQMMERVGNLLQETKGAMDTVLSHSQALEDSSHQSAKTAQAVAAAMEEISQGTSEQTNEAEKSSVMMNDLAAQIETVVSKTSEVEKISGFARELSEKSNNAVEQLIVKSKETDQITETIIHDILDLNNSADEIREITETITAIAEQTNLLGLNASIEAARAGEMGQGFAVVSEEINKLAIQSRDAAKTINNILLTIQAKTQNSGKTAQQAHQIIEEQRLAVQSAQGAFVEISDATRDIITRINLVSSIITEMNANKEQTIQSIINISSISEQTASSAQEVSAASEEQTALAEQVRSLAKQLHKSAEELAESIAKFQI
jgi:methyl-accepting chemotaxis protein